MERAAGTAEQADVDEKAASPNKREYIRKAAVFVSVFAIIWSLFQLYAAGAGMLDAISLRAWPIIFLLVMVFLLYPAWKKTKHKTLKYPTVVDIICILLTIVSFGYLLINYSDIAL